MDPKAITDLSKFLSFVLRHKPEAVGLEIDPNGWVEIEQLVEKCHQHGKTLTKGIVEAIVTTSPKRRFAISEDGLRVRANQGHSIEIDLGYEPKEPPGLLFHGTVSSSIESIRCQAVE